MFQITSEAIQRWTRVGLYVGFGALANYGVNVSNGVKELAISSLGIAATVLWTVYGSRMNAMLSEIGKIRGVEEALVKVDANLIDPKIINSGTPTNVVAKPVN